MIVSTPHDQAGRRYTTGRNPSGTSLLVALWVLLPGGVSHAQPIPTGNTVAGDEATRAGVYLDDSLEAADELARANRLAEAERWNEAAELMLRTAGRFAKHVIRHEAGLYVNVAEYVNRRVADWPAPGLATYRRLCDSAARLAADTAVAERSLPALLEVTERYFCTTHALRTAEMAAELAIEAGRFDLAADLYGRLLRQHPDRQKRSVTLESKLALVHAWAGRAESARRLVEQVREASPEHRVQWGQTSRRIAEAIDAEIQPFPADPDDHEHAFDWPLYGGNPTRNRIVVSQAQARAALWRIDGVAPDAAPNSQRRSSAALQRGAYLNQHVVVGHGIIYLHDADTVRAIRVGNGQDAWPPYHADGLNVSRREFARLNAPPPFHAPTLAGDRLYVRLGGDPPTSRRSVAESILICLDAHTGKLVWRVGRKELGPRFARTYFDGSPLVADGKLYVIARRRRSVGFEDAYLLQLDAETGRLDWQTHLASGSVGGFGYPRSTVAVPAIIGQQIYVCTNLGVVVAVSLHNGRVRWARLYGSRPASRVQLWSRPYRQTMHPWQYEPIRAWGDRLVVKPLDADRLLVLDPGSGALVKEIHLDSLQNLEYILGIIDDRLYGVGQRVICWDLQKDREVWARSVPAGKPYGRGCMTTTHLFVPTDEGLYRFPLDGSTPEGRSWDGRNEGGNILVTPDQILVAGNDHLSAYARKEAALARLQARVTAAPDEPERHLDLADLAFRVEEYELGLTSLDTAAERAGGYALILEPSVKHRVFRNCLHFADSLLRLDPPQRRSAIALYFKAGQCAPDAEGHVEFRRKLAVLHTNAGEYARAVARWQQILLDRSLGSIPVHDPAGKAVTSGTLAEQAIDRLIRRHGPDVYGRFEDQARALLAAGRDGGDIELLERVADLYPNARSAPAALIAWGHALRTTRRPLEAARIYRRAITRYRDAVHAPDVMRWLSDSYREAGQPLTAAAWLARAEREFPQARITIGGERLRWSEYRQRTLGVAVYRERSTPRIELPITPAGSRTFDKPVELIEPEPTTDVNARWDFLAVYTDDHLTVIEPTTGRSWWPAPVPCPLKPRLLGSSDTAAVFATDFKVFSVQLDTGQVLWEVGDYPAKLGNAAVDPEEHKALAFVGFKSFNGRIIAVRESGEVLCLDAETGLFCNNAYASPPAPVRTTARCDRRTI